MRLLVLLLLLTYAAAHPAALHTLVTLGTHATGALSHLGSARCGLHAAPGASGSAGRMLGSHWNVAALGSHWNSRGA